MVHHLQHIVDLVEICRLKGIQHIVISPGSRNAALIKLFAANKYFKLHSIVDERSAAFYGLGIATATQKPVVLLCTSGTAVVNYAPALAEAFYRRIPLIAITADRPEHLIDQQDNQTIRQVNVFQNFIKDSMHLHQPITDAYELDAQHYGVVRVINSASNGLKGPVHINVPVAEPFYIEMPKPSENIKIFNSEKIVTGSLSRLSKCWKESPKCLIISGEGSPNLSLNQTINALSEHAVILAEPISNIKGENIIAEVDRIMMEIETLENEKFKPDILISFGGPIVSKRLKQWLQKQKNLIHFRIAEEDDHIDTYQNLTELIIGNPTETFAEMLLIEKATDYTFIENWRSLYAENKAHHLDALKPLSHSDLSVFQLILKDIPANAILHIGNSSPVRYAQLFDLSNFDEVYSNRGVSGIDGCLSTAAGFASQSDKLNLLILGDLSFVYDSNGLWNSNLPANLKIVVINNQGGGIFRLLPGPSEMESFEEFMETKHTVDIGKLTAAFGVEYFEADESNLATIVEAFIKFENTSLLEVKTPRMKNAEVYKEYIKRIKNL